MERERIQVAYEWLAGLCAQPCSPCQLWPSTSGLRTSSCGESLGRTTLLRSWVTSASRSSCLQPLPGATPRPATSSALRGTKPTLSAAMGWFGLVGDAVWVGGSWDAGRTPSLPGFMLPTSLSLVTRYIAPETMYGEIGARSDVYSLGVIILQVGSCACPQCVCTVSDRAVEIPVPSPAALVPDGHRSSREDGCPHGLRTSVYSRPRCSGA
jgi:hypothetical protein